MIYQKNDIKVRNGVKHPPPIWNGVTTLHRIKNVYVRGSLTTTDIAVKIREYRMYLMCEKRFGRVEKINNDIIVVK